MQKLEKEEEDEVNLTARVSVATAATTNIKMKVITISSRNDCTSLPKGSVAPSEAAGCRISFNIKAAIKDPPHCAPMYNGTCNTQHIPGQQTHICPYDRLSHQNDYHTTNLSKALIPACARCAPLIDGHKKEQLFFISKLEFSLVLLCR